MRAHGTLSRYRRDHCRCARCRRADSEYRRNRKAALAVLWGRPVTVHVPATPAARIVAQLRAAGWTAPAIAQAADVSLRTVQRLAAGVDRVEYWVVERLARLA